MFLAIPQKRSDKEWPTFRLHACLLQSRMRLHFISHAYVFEHGNSLVWSPQRHFFSIISKHWLQSPLWQRSAQMWLPQPNVFWHVFPHGPISSLHAASDICTIKQRFCVKRTIDRKNRQTNLFATRTRPREAQWAKTARTGMTFYFATMKLTVIELITLLIAMPLQTVAIPFLRLAAALAFLFALFHARWAFGWFVTGQTTCMNAAEKFLITLRGEMTKISATQSFIVLHSLWIVYTFFPQFHDFCEQRMVFKFDWPQSQEMDIICGHGGHGPIWKLIFRLYGSCDSGFQRI